MEGTGEVQFDRWRLLTRIDQVRPRLLLLSAPAGFGKSTLAREYGLLFASTATCDCAALASERELCRRLLAAGVALEPRSNADFAELQYSLSEAGDAGAGEIESALQAWTCGVGPSAMIFENAEHLTERPALRKLLERILVMAPAASTLIVCSRTPLLLQTSKIAPPHRILTLRAADLAFNREEITEVFGETNVSETELDEVAAVTRGWPIGTLMLRRLAQEERLRECLTRLDDVAFEDMHAYLIDEVLDALVQNELDALIACTVLEGATAADVSAAIGIADAERLLVGLAQASPFVSQTHDRTFLVHPLLGAAIERAYGTRRSRLAENAAGELLRHGAFVSAAKIYRQLGDADACARALCAEAAVTHRKPSIGFSPLLASLDNETLARYPVLRGLTTYAQRFRGDPHLLREQTRAIWLSLPPGTHFELRCKVGNPLARISYETGHLGEAERLLRALEVEAGGIPAIPRTTGEAFTARTLGCVLARSGRLSEAEDYFQKGYFAIPGAEFVLSRYWIERAIIERLRGRRDQERRHFEHAIELATEADATVHIACALAEAAFGAWLAGEDELCVGYVRRLEERITRDAMRGFAHFCAVAYGNVEANPSGTEQPNWLACAHLIACARAAGSVRLARALEAKAAADASQDVFLQMLANVALALVAPDRRGELMSEALVLAASIEAVEPQAAITTLLSDRPPANMLRDFVARLERGKSDEREVVRVDVLGRSVYRNGTAIDIPERELALLIALARQRRSYGRAEIVPLLWPELDDLAAREAFNSCLYRLRTRLPGVVLWTREGGYRLHEGVRVDIREIEQWVASLTSQRTLRDHERELLQSLYHRLRNVTIPDSELWEWLAPLAVRAGDMGRTVAQRLAASALGSERFDEALGIARDLIEDDPCDEAAREVAIRAHLGLGRRSEALREFRSYRNVLRRELETEPSADLSMLLREAVPSQGEDPPRVREARLRTAREAARP